MIKKIIPFILLFCLLMSTCVLAENAEEGTVAPTPPATEDIPVGRGGRSGGDGNMDIPPQAPAEGKRAPFGENIPSTDNGGTVQNPAQPDNVAPQQGTESEQNGNLPEEGNMPEGGNMPDRMAGWGEGFSDTQSTPVTEKTGFLGFVTTYSTPIVSVVLLILAFVFVIFYKRKQY